MTRSAFIATLFAPIIGRKNNKATARAAGRALVELGKACAQAVQSRNPAVVLVGDEIKWNGHVLTMELKDCNRRPRPAA